MRQARRCAAWVLLVLAVGAARGGTALYTRHNAPKTPTVEELELREAISQYGITWTFERKAPAGQFVNGDRYVVGPVTVIGIDPKPLWGEEEVGELIEKEAVHETRYKGKQARNGSVLNPPAKPKLGGYDSRMASGRYDPALFAHLPIRMKPGDSLVSTVSRRNNELTKFSGQHVDPLRVAAVLSCVAEPQPPDAFRPSYCDAANARPHLARELRRELLPSVPRTPKAPASLAKNVAALQKPWLDTVEFGFAAPMENLPHYGQQMAEVVGQAGLLLMMDYTPEEKEPLLINLVQVGLDFWGIVRAGGTWPAHGGLHSGRKWPIIFAGVMLGDADMQSPTKRYPDCHFGEDDQTAFCPYEYRGKVYDKGWTGATVIFTGHSLAGTGGDRGDWKSGWGNLELFHPSEWPVKKPGALPASEAYRRANTSGAWIGEALAARMMHIEKAWGHDAFFAYVDRWMCEDDAPQLVELKNAGYEDMTNVKPRDFRRQGFCWDKLAEEMWAKYRDHLPPAPDGHADPPAEDWNKQAATAAK